MTIIQKTHFLFPKTTDLLALFNTDITDVLRDINYLHLNENEQLKNKIINDIKLEVYEKYRGIVEEIFLIELGKINFSSTETEFNLIKKNESKQNHQREELLYKALDDLENILFIQNPMSEVFESQWNIVNNASKLQPFSHISKSPKEPYYFVLLKVGIKSPLTDTNVLEYSLTKHESLLLECFENVPITVSDALNQFTSCFEIEDISEEETLKAYFFSTFRRLIFYKLLIIHA